ncbi:MAG: 50S ribosomal protein L1 [Nitrospirae bacterium]|nr:MAG: 50S ribosomal protein L1 [Nitrospirota bacterium]
MGKKWKAAAALVEPKMYGLKESVELVKRTAYAKFDETVEMALRLGVEPKRSDQMVRGSVVLPHGTGIKVRILVFAKGEKEREAREAGAETVGGDELVEKVKGGWLEFDTAIATPDMMGNVGKLGKLLGPRGLMPNPKTGTVTFEVAKAIQEIRKGRVEYKIEKAGIVHVRIGKVSFGAAKLLENAKAILESVIRAKPASSKGRYLQSVTLSSTMGPSIRLDPVVLGKTLD